MTQDGSNQKIVDVVVRQRATTDYTTSLNAENSAITENKSWKALA